MDTRTRRLAGFTEEIHVLDVLHAGVSDSTAGGEFNVSEPTICTEQVHIIS